MAISERGRQRKTRAPSTSHPPSKKKLDNNNKKRRDDSDSVLLLQRRSRHHDRAWGLPGGNVEPSDLSLLDAAEREAAEEMGSLPRSFSVLTRIDAVRGGKKKEKAYSAFVLRVPGEVAGAWSPVLNEESRGWRWVGREEASRLAGASGGGGGGGGGEGGVGRKEGAASSSSSSSFVRHPVAADLLTPGTQSRALLDEAVSAVWEGGGGSGGGGGGGGGGADGNPATGGGGGEGRKK